MSESKTPRTDECICSFAPGGWDVGRLVMVSRTIEAELTTALQRAEKAEKDLMRLSCTFAIERDARHQAEAELSRYRAAEKALPEEPPRWEDRTDKRWPVTVVPKWAYDALRAHAAAVTAERDAMREDAKLGRIAMRFVDRAGDVCEQDPAEKICQEFYEAMSAAVIDARKETP